MCFSADGRMLAAQGGAPNWKLLLWDVMATKVAASIRSVDGTVAYQVRVFSLMFLLLLWICLTLQL
jgi:hypothetical protein